MIDINIIRKNPDILKKSLERRQNDPSVIDRVAELDKQWRAKLTEVEILKSKRNKVSKEISKIKEKDKREKKISEMRTVGEKIAVLRLTSSTASDLIDTTNSGQIPEEQKSFFEAIVHKFFAP